jgi:hypothetical protein
MARETQKPPKMGAFGGFTQWGPAVRERQLQALSASGPQTFNRAVLDGVRTFRRLVRTPLSSIPSVPNCPRVCSLLPPPLQRSRTEKVGRGRQSFRNPLASSAKLFPLAGSPLGGMRAQTLAARFARGPACRGRRRPGRRPRRGPRAGVGQRRDLSDLTNRPRQSRFSGSFMPDL